MNIAQHLDSTYLKLESQSGLSAEETRKIVFDLAEEAHQLGIYAVMIRPEYIREVKEFLSEKGSYVKVGTVIGFHEGTATTAEKRVEAEKAIADGADELDFVLNYNLFKTSGFDAVSNEVEELTGLALQNHKVAKWIIETAALTNQQIGEVTRKISELVHAKFPGQETDVFIKSSTGFYPTEEGQPNGATPENIKIMMDNAQNLPVKAAGGVRNTAEAQAMIDLGVQRIGTSAAGAIVRGGQGQGNY